MNNCKNLKLKLNHTLYCKKLNKEIKLKQCTNCKYKEYQKKIPVLIKNRKKIKKIDGIKKKSAKLSKLENNRFSIITNDLKHCIVCGKEKNHLHEVFPGASRINSIKYGMVIPVCVNCHQELHKNGKLTMYYKRLAQTRFEEYYKDIDFVSIFHKNFK